MKIEAWLIQVSEEPRELQRVEPNFDALLQRRRNFGRNAAFMELFETSMTVAFYHPDMCKAIPYSMSRCHARVALSKSSTICLQMRPGVNL
jgi:hypothetical protein